MNPKANALRIIRFDHPQRVMVDPPEHVIGYRGVNHEGFIGGGDDSPVGMLWEDIWGVGWYRELEGVMGFPRINPLANLAEMLPQYCWPDPQDERICGQIYIQAKAWDQADTFLTGSHRDTLWENAYMLVGMENLMCLFYSEPQAVHELLHGIMDFQIGIAGHYVNNGVEKVNCGDDLGTQNGLLLSPRILNEFFVPEYRRLYQFYKQMDVLIEFHSCGHITPLIDLFIDMGIDILNPVQATANDLDFLRQKTQGRMALHGGVRSSLLVSGPVEAIRAEVGQRIYHLGEMGGYFCAPDQVMPWPTAHYQALVQAVEEYGQYPVNRE